MKPFHHTHYLGFNVYSEEERRIAILDVATDIFPFCQAAIASNAYAVFAGYETKFKSSYGKRRCNKVECPFCHAQRHKALLRRIYPYFEAVATGFAFARFITVTLPIHNSFTLRQSIDALNKLWKEMLSCYDYRTLKRNNGIKGHMKVIEISLVNGFWRVHAHILTFAETNYHAFVVAKYTLRYFEEIMKRAGYKTNEFTCIAKMVFNAKRLAKYFTKLEWSPNKKPKLGSLTPMEVAGLALSGDKDMKKHFKDYREQMKGFRHGIISPQLRVAIFSPAIKPRDEAA